MSQCSELWVKRSAFRETKVVNFDTPALKEGEVLVAIDKFGLTANNVSYALSGDMLGYWKFYPAEGDWGKVPVWGCANVVESSCDEIPVGERLWGFFPMASHTVLKPGKIRETVFNDIAEHRSELPGLYNQYRRTAAEPSQLQAMEDERCLLFPLFMTSYVVYDYLIDNNFFGAEQVLIGSVSSKTGFGLAKMLKDDPAVTARVIGLTSAGNKDFVESMGCCDEVVIYGDEAQMDKAAASAFVDMSGDLRLTKTLHQHFTDQMKASIKVGATHWEEGGSTKDLPGAKPAFFFAPSHIAKREQEWGRGVPMARGFEASAKVAASVKDLVNVDWTRGVDDLAKLWVDLLDNKVPASRGLMVSLLEEAI